jgi:Holliday junction resolvasome RuvABC endonuclease subunit
MYRRLPEWAGEDLHARQRLRLRGEAAMIVLGVDPGAVNMGHAILSWDGSAADWLGGGRVLPSEPNWIEIVSQVQLVVVEWPHVGPRQAGQAILETRSAAEKVATTAELCGVPVFKVAPAEWRKAVLGRTRRTADETIDAIAARILPHLIQGMPMKLVSHVRDAAGVALLGCRMHGRKVA